MLGDPKNAYNIDTLRQYLANATTINDIPKIKKYVCDYFGHCSSSPGVLMWFPEIKEFKHYSRKDALDLFFPLKRNSRSMGEAIRVLNPNTNKNIIFDTTHWFFNINKVTYYENYDPVQSRVYEGKNGTRYLNRFAGFLYKSPQSLNEYTKEVHENLFLVLEHMRVVLCSEIADQYYYFALWVANVITGNRMKTATYLYSVEHGTGKTMFTDFLRKKVLGDHITLLTGSNKFILGDFNIEMRGKILILLEEMPATKKGDWNAFSNRLKFFIDTDTIQVEEKHKTPFPINHTASLMINSNSKVVKVEKTDRRYFIPDIAKKQSPEYYKRLAKAMNYPGVGEAFYRYMIELIKLNPEFDPIKIPMSNMKRDMIGTGLNTLHAFLKFNYLSSDAKLQQSNKKIPTNYFYNNYKEFHEVNYRNKEKFPSITDVRTKMNELGFTSSIQRVAEKRLRCYNLEYNTLFDKLVKSGIIDPDENLEEPEDYKAPETKTSNTTCILKCPEIGKASQDSDTKKTAPPPIPPKPKHLQIKKINAIESLKDCVGEDNTEIDIDYDKVLDEILNAE